MSKPYPDRPPAPQPVQHVHVVMPHVRQSQALPALVSLFLPGVGQLIQGRVIAWLVFSLAWGIGLVLCFFCVGFFVVPLVALIATVEAALYDPAQPPSAAPMLAMLGALAVSVAAALLLMMGIIGLGATAVSNAPVNNHSPSASPRNRGPAGQRQEDAPIEIEIDEPSSNEPASSEPTITRPTSKVSRSRQRAAERAWKNRL